MLGEGKEEGKGAWEGDGQQYHGCDGAGLHVAVDFVLMVHVSCVCRVLGMEGEMMTI